MLEPLVDVVDAKNVVTYQPAPILQLDILTCSKARARREESRRILVPSP